MTKFLFAAAALALVASPAAFAKSKRVCMKDGAEVAAFDITWSFKKKSRQPP